MDVFVVVPARGGSKRLPGKNLRLLGGRSLVSWTSDAIMNAGLLENAVLSTDDPLIAEEGRRCGLSVPFMRPAALATDGASTVCSIIHALDWRRERTGSDPDAVLVLQPTSPLRGYSCILSSIELLASRGDVNSVVGMTVLSLPASALFCANKVGVVKPVAPEVSSQVLIPNGALYLVRTVALRECHSLYADSVLALPLDPRRGVDIDTEADWQLAEALFAAGLPDESVARPVHTSNYSLGPKANDPRA